jgi:Tfp pilus assembly protein PilZ
MYFPPLQYCNGTTLQKVQRSVIYILERRDAPRFNVAVPFVFCPVAAPPGVSYSEASINISNSGMFFKTKERLAVGLQVRVMLNMPEIFNLGEKSVCQFTGRVVHVGPAGLSGYSQGVGVKFFYKEPVIDEMCEGIKALGSLLIKAAPAATDKI